MMSSDNSPVYESEHQALMRTLSLVKEAEEYLGEMTRQLKIYLQNDEVDFDLRELINLSQELNDLFISFQNSKEEQEQWVLQKIKSKH